MNTFSKLTVLAALLTLAACASDSSKDGDGASSGSSSGAGTYGGTGSSSSGYGTAGDGSATGTAKVSTPSGRVLYFNLDQSELKPEAQALADAWAAYLTANPGAKVRLEGHCDERGSREYNVSLGERRGNAVLAALTGQGVGARQVSVSSFGEERPVALGHDELAWTQNRRVEIVP